MASALERGLRSFGHSVHGGRDLDGNQYPDLVVGAHDSNAAVYFRSVDAGHGTGLELSAETCRV